MVQKIQYVFLLSLNDNPLSLFTNRICVLQYKTKKQELLIKLSAIKPYGYSATFEML